MNGRIAAMCPDRHELMPLCDPQQPDDADGVDESERKPKRLVGVDEGHPEAARPPHPPLPKPGAKRRRRVGVEAHVDVPDGEAEMLRDDAGLEVFSRKPEGVRGEDAAKSRRPGDHAGAAGHPGAVVTTQHGHVVLDRLQLLDQRLSPRDGDLDAAEVGAGRSCSRHGASRILVGDRVAVDPDHVFGRRRSGAPRRANSGHETRPVRCAACTRQPVLA